MIDDSFGNTRLNRILLGVSTPTIQKRPQRAQRITKESRKSTLGPHHHVHERIADNHCQVFTHHEEVIG